MDRKTDKTLSAQEICAILKAASEAQVRVLKFGGLFLRFEPKMTELAAPQVEAPRPQAEEARTDPGTLPPGYRWQPGKGPVWDPERPASHPATEIAEIQKQQAEKSVAEEEISAREAQIEDALIEDPALFEELLSEGHLEPYGSTAVSSDPDSGT